MRTTLSPLLSAAALFALAAASLPAEPAPGELFRDHTYSIRFSELDPGNKRANTVNLRNNSLLERNLDIYDLDNAARAEMLVEYWGGHIGTAGQSFRVNGSPWMEVAQPAGTPTPPQCYYRTLLGSAATPIPLELLRRGRNVFHFTAGSQICHSFDWGFYWIYSFTVRVYYKPAAAAEARLAGVISSPAGGATVGDRPRFRVRPTNTHTGVARVDLIGLYEDFNWEGDGRFKRWHYITERGLPHRHIGSAAHAPFEVEWDTTWIPDQAEPVRVVAWITDTHGYTRVTPEIQVTLKRPGRSVRMYTARNVPEKFGVRLGARLSCDIPIPEAARRAKAARLVLSTWSAAHDGRVSLNGRELAAGFGLIHNYSFDSIPVPVEALQPGNNVFSLHSPTKEHAAEINWPGPVLLIEY